MCIIPQAACNRIWLLSVEILLFDALAVLKFWWKYNVTMYRARNVPACVSKWNTRNRNGFGQRWGYYAPQECWRKFFHDYHTKNSLQDIYSSVCPPYSWSLDHNVIKKTWTFTGFFSETIILHYSIRNLQHLKVHWAMSVSFPTKCILFHKFISLSSRIFEYHAQNWNTPQT